MRKLVLASLMLAGCAGLNPWEDGIGKGMMEAPAVHYAVHDPAVVPPCPEVRGGTLERRTTVYSRLSTGRLRLGLTCGWLVEPEAATDP